MLSLNEILWDDDFLKADGSGATSPSDENDPNASLAMCCTMGNPCQNGNSGWPCFVGSHNCF